jgi:hypothetical protein
MSINIRFTKFIAVLSFLLITGVQQNGVPTFALLLIYLFQFFNDILSSTSMIFWEGLITIPILGFLFLFLISKNYKVLLLSFSILLAAVIYLTGIINHYQRINFTFIIPSIIFLISSIYALIVTKKKRNHLIA